MSLGWVGSVGWFATDIARFARFLVDHLALQAVLESSSLMSKCNNDMDIMWHAWIDSSWDWFKAIIKKYRQLRFRLPISGCLIELGLFDTVPVALLKKPDMETTNMATCVTKHFWPKWKLQSQHPSTEMCSRLFASRLEIPFPCNCPNYSARSFKAI